MVGWQSALSIYICDLHWQSLADCAAKYIQGVITEMSELRLYNEANRVCPNELAGLFS
jgi:hypothetical protein